jgi:putative NADH-flavin reductase
VRLVILGSTGRTGRLLVEQALFDGHEVTAVARRPESLALRHPHLTSFAGDAFDPSSVAAAVAGCDSVVSAIGPDGIGLTDLYSSAATNLISAMHAAQVRRLICLSVAAADPEVDLPFPFTLLAKVVLRPLFRGPYDDALRMEAVLAASELDWTVIRAPRLTNGPRVGAYRTAVGAHLRHPMAISRADLADCVLKLVTDTHSYRAWVEIAY